MSLRDLETAARWLLSADGALFGLAYAGLAYESIRQMLATSSALRQIRDAPSVHPSGLRALLLDQNPPGQRSGQSSSTEMEGGRLVVVRGMVDLNGNGGPIVAQESRKDCVVYWRNQTFMFFKWRGLSRYEWMNNLRSVVVTTSWRKLDLPSISRKVPFVLAELESLDYVVVDMEGSRHPLPLTTVHYRLQPIDGSPFTFLQALLGLEFPVILSDKEKILPLGKEISAVGICSLRDGIPVIKSCKHLPYFLSSLTKAEIATHLAIKTKVLMWSAMFFGSLAIGILGYSIVRNWSKLKEWYQQLAHQQNVAAENEFIDENVPDDEESGDIPEEQLCVICSTRRRLCAFLPCGHLVSCRCCALSVRREEAPQCPVCAQSVESSVRIYES